MVEEEGGGAIFLPSPEETAVSGTSPGSSDGATAPQTSDGDTQTRGFFKRFNIYNIYNIYMWDDI